jgi:Icc protein
VADSCLKIIQITDSHLRKEQEGTLLGMNTRDSLDAVLELIHVRAECPDLVLATGDLAQDGSAEAYRCFEQKMAGFSCPVIWFSGNHDDPVIMASTVSRRDSTARVWKDKYWKLIFLDSSVRNRVHGELARSELEFLQEELESDQDKHIAICFHHHPLPINCAWLDTIGLHNGDEFFSIVDQFSHIRLVLWGHIHQEFDQLRARVRLLASPSTCVQFKPGSTDFAVDDLAPGYRWLKLAADGGIDTAVVRADHIDFEVDLSSKGY